jgi:bifunctional polynucleotide phosphatase/kinase
MATGMTTNIAGFDFDGTLVRPREGRQFPKDKNDWRWMRPSVPDRLRALAAEGWRLVIVTDQTKGWKEDMISAVVAAVGVPIEVVIQRAVVVKGAGPDVKRGVKPDTSQFLTRGIALSYYVGDAAGRAGDWSDCDRLFAERLGVPFYTPEEFFPAPAALERTVAVGAPREVVVMVGYPASGKSTIARDLMARGGYYRVDGDALATATAMVRDAKKQPADTRIVFDSTGGTVKRRAAFIEWAKSAGRPVRIIWVTTDIDTAMDWNAARGRSGTGAHVPAIAFYVYRKHFEEPTVAECEGAEVVIVD